MSAPEFEGAPLSPPMKVYLAGPMKGFAESNIPAFNAAKQQLEQKGFVVFSPPDLTAGLFPEGELSADDYRRAMQVDLQALALCGAVAVLRGWQRSSGARYEVHTARFIYGIPVYWAETLEPVEEHCVTHAEGQDDECDQRCENCGGWRDAQVGATTADDCWLCDQCATETVDADGSE